MSIGSTLKIPPRAVLKAMRLYAPYYLLRYGYLREMGWYDSYHQQRVIGALGEPIPWLTYPLIRFMSERLTSSMTVFEYGSGNSTLWWASRVKRVISIEHTRHWYEYLASRVPSNVELIFADDKDLDNYSKLAANYVDNLDIIIIDGRHRVECAKKSLSGITSDGVIIWDDMERQEYAEGSAFLAESGFRRIDFTGMGSARVEGWTTSIFYRTDNCLGI